MNHVDKKNVGAKVKIEYLKKTCRIGNSRKSDEENIQETLTS